MNTKPCVLVMGPEGSGSQYAARRVSSLLGVDGWAGIGFNCCDRWDCDRDNGFLEPCRPVPALVCHRSLPFAGVWPNLGELSARYECHFVLCTRDRSIAIASARLRFGTRAARARADSEHAGAIMAGLLECGRPCFVWSYESRALLGSAYERELARFLGAEPDAAPAEEFRPANARYLRPMPEIQWNRLVRRLVKNGR